MAKLVSKVYGDALFSLADENQTIDEVWAEVKALRQIVAGNQELNKIMNHPAMTGEQKLSFILEVFEGRLSQTMLGFLNIIVKKGHFADLESVLNYFDAQAKEYMHIGVVYVKTAAPINDTQKHKIEKRLLEVSEYETFEMNYEVDENLIGGMVIRIGDRVLDDSIRTKIDDMTFQLKKVRLG